MSRRAALIGGSLAATLGGALRVSAEDSGLPLHTKAPDFVGIEHWLNSEPLTMAGLRGKVVLIDFWTYSCINCLRTLPYLTRWYDAYKDKGFVLVGVHTPEFPFERQTRNVETAIERFGIKYPVAQDNTYSTWKAYNNVYWPAEYLIDQQGNIVLEHFGEGKYDEMEDAIRTLLAAGPAVAKDNGVDLTRIGSPEMYFGTDRLAYLGNAEKPGNGPQTYTIPANLPLNHFALVGTWDVQKQNAVLMQGRRPGPAQLLVRQGLHGRQQPRPHHRDPGRRRKGAAAGDDPGKPALHAVRQQQLQPALPDPEHPEGRPERLHLHLRLRRYPPVLMPAR
ncbi:MAG: redoxin domain-containing protein [Acetobacteraceae bacterium]